MQDKYKQTLSQAERFVLIPIWNNNFLHNTQVIYHDKKSWKIIDWHAIGIY